MSTTLANDYATKHGTLVGTISMIANRVKFGDYTREQIAAMLDEAIGYAPEAPTPLNDITNHRTQADAEAYVATLGFAWSDTLAAFVHADENKQASLTDFGHKTVCTVWEAR